MTAETGVKWLLRFLAITTIPALYAVVLPQSRFVAVFESNIIPLPTGNRNEECRLLYVAMTRAREYLFLTRSLRRTDNTARAGKAKVRTPRTPCPFLEHGPVDPKSGEEFIKELWTDG